MGFLFKRRNTRYVDASGRQCRKGDAGAVKKQTRSREWYGEYRDANGITRRVKLCRDKAAAQAMLNDLVRDGERGAAGLVDPHAEAGKLPLSGHLGAFQRHLQGKGSTPRHVAETVARVEAVTKGCRFQRIGDISASAVQQWLADQRQAERFGVRTSNAYLIAAKSFTRWLARDHRAADDRLSHLSRINADADVRRQRRVLSADELANLFTAAKSNGDKAGLDGESRAMLYRVAAFTGLRASELASLTADSLNLDSDPPTVTVEAGYSKRRQRDVLPLHSELAQKLREWLAGLPQRELLPIDGARPIPRLWPGTWAKRRAGAAMIRHDLKAAGIPYRDSTGQTADFHSLRHSYISHLAGAGVHPAEAQALARHSDVNLTLGRYTHVGTAGLATALGKLPSIPDADPQVTVKVTVADAMGCDAVSLDETDGRGTSDLTGGRNPCETSGIEANRGALRVSERELPGRDLNPDYLIQSQAFAGRKAGNRFGLRFEETPSDSTSDSVGPETAADPRLTAIAIAWPMLTESTRQMLAGIVASNLPRGRLKKPKPKPDPDGTDRPDLII